MAEPIATVGDLAGICGHDGTNWEKVLIDASKRLVVAIAAFSDVLEVEQDTPGDLLVGAHGFDGGLCPHRHEYRRTDYAVVGRYGSCPRVTAGRIERA